MKSSTLIRLGGMSALAGGVIRTLASFIPLITREPSLGIELLYLVIDILILFGLIGIYAVQHEKAGICGFAGFLLAMTGTALIVGPDGKLGSLDVYWAGATVISVGMTLLAVGSLRAGVLTRRAPLLWILSTLAGIAGSWLNGGGYGFLIAGIAFGAGFAIAGYEVMNKTAKS